MGKSRCKSRKHKGGNPKPVAVDCNKGLCPTLTGAGGSLMGMANAGVKQQKTDADRQAAASKHLASGGGKKKKGGAARIICPQPAAGSGGSISAGGSPYAGCSGQSTSQQQGANAVHDGEAKNLSTASPKSPFASLSGGKSRRGKSRRGKSRRGKTRRRRRKSRGKKKRKTRKGRKKQRRTRKKTRGKRRY